jgi:catechol 2,3-dioxygenase-like lactoylglutathione lyase family enzyme
MFNDSKFFATVAVKNLEDAKLFYEGKLGLERAAENPRGIAYATGGGQLFIYQSPSAGSSQASVATWELDEIDGLVQKLQDKGLAFERYDIPGATWQDNIATMGQVKVAWFTDPDGNIFSVGTPQP